MKLRLKLGVAGSAIFGGPENEYRYVLRRIWDERLKKAVWICLNPSTADAEDDDPTLSKIQTFSRLWGYGSVVALNLFAYRSKFPRWLLAHASPVGPMNDYYIAQEVADAGIVVCAWGRDGAYLDRASEVQAKLRQMGIRPQALKVNKDGSPMHPLYVNTKVVPQEMAA